MQFLSMPASIRAEICKDIEIKVASDRNERKAAMELVYRSYLEAGLCAPNDNGLRCTSYQLLPTTDIVIAKLRDEVISTLSLVRDGELGLPMEEIYPEEVAARRAAGHRLAEVSCLADRRRDPGRFFELFREIARLTVQLALRIGVDELVVAVHPRHAAFYRRCMAFEPIGGQRDYHVVQGSPAVALSLNFANAEAAGAKGWHEFFAKPLPGSVLKTCPITPTDRSYFTLLTASDAENCTLNASRPETENSSQLLCA